MSKVYLVTEGQYSSFHVVAVLGDRVAAELLQNKVDHHNRVEEFELDAAPTYPDGLLFLVDMDIDGDSQVERDDAENAVFVTDQGVPALYGRTGISPRSFRVWADDEQHAVKIVNERRLAMIASGEWTAP